MKLDNVVVKFNYRNGFGTFTVSDGSGKTLTQKWRPEQMDGQSDNSAEVLIWPDDNAYVSGITEVLAVFLNEGAMHILDSDEPLDKPFGEGFKFIANNDDVIAWNSAIYNSCQKRDNNLMTSTLIDLSVPSVDVSITIDTTDEEFAILNDNIGESIDEVPFTDDLRQKFDDAFKKLDSGDFNIDCKLDDFSIFHVSVA